MPDSVGHVLKEAGHEVVLLREHLAPNSPDPLVAAVAEMNEAILISLDGDFRSLAPRIAIGRRRFKKLSRIALKCNAPRAAARVKESLSLIEHEWSIAQNRADKRMIIEIMQTAIRTIR